VLRCISPRQTYYRNEAPYLREWIEYHRMIGFDAFILMNDNSTDDTQCILDAYAQEGIVIRIPKDIDDHDYKLRESNQHVFDACTDYLKTQQTRYDPRYTWMMTHDVDEFVWFNKTVGVESLQDAMQHLIQSQDGEEVVKSMEVPRLFFGSSGHDHYEDGLVMDRFNHRFNLDSCPKVIPRFSFFARHRAASQRRIANETRRGRRLSDEAAPISYCTHGNRRSSFRNVKSISHVSSLAQNCSRLDKATDKVVPDKCSSTHRHTLHGNQNTNSTNKTLATYFILSRNDERYLDQDTVGNAIVISHYGIKSREEFYQRICASVWREKYYKCPSCTPKTYFDDTETFANNYQDDRMAPFSSDLKARLKETKIGNECNTQPVKHSIDFYETVSKVGKYK
jgi:hypothetical protein